MLGSCVYHLLYFNGNTLGVSGIYGSTLRKLFNIHSHIVLSDATKATANTYDSAEQNADNVDVNPAPNDVDDQKVQQDEDGDTWKPAFTAGLLLSGLLLRVLRPYIEKDLGVPIFDETFVNGQMFTSPFITLLVGFGVGIGTKVTSILRFLIELVGSWMYLWTHALRNIAIIDRSILATATFFATAVGVVQYTGTPGPSVSSFDKLWLHNSRITTNPNSSSIAISFPK